MTVTYESPTFTNHDNHVRPFKRRQEHELPADPATFQLMDRIVTFEQRLPLKGMAILLLDVTFLRDFGPWQKGQRVRQLTVDLAAAAIGDGRLCSPIRLTQVLVAQEAVT